MATNGVRIAVVRGGYLGGGIAQWFAGAACEPATRVGGPERFRLGQAAERGQAGGQHGLRPRLDGQRPVPEPCVTENDPVPLWVRVFAGVEPVAGRDCHLSERPGRQRRRAVG